MSDEQPTGSRTARPGQRSGGVGVSTTLGIIVAAIAVLLGFLILRDINRDRDGGVATGPVETQPASTDEVPSDSTDVMVSTTTLPRTGYKVLVANASGVSGSAGQMSTALQAQGFIVQQPATNAAETVGKQTVTVVYYVPGFESGAAAVSQVLGGVATQPVATPAPVESGDLGEATVLVMLGTDLAGKLLPGALPTADPAVTETTTG
ncbi:MAG: LytR C-terminal domain-containing protein [Actinomycetota bacterium]|nr:LytR C-terminal domain-containing protein [Actinomycetota bacterium]MDA2972348.1 LytR C-terminal domain-containing protein [Actinomycetota bacterium]MDA3000632.1 LytR C-terminal domain-containing protein [Actinomycetota bacterium]